MELRRKTLFKSFQGRFKPTSVSLITVMGITYLLFRPVVAFVAHNQVDYTNHLSFLKPDMDATAVLQLVQMFPHFLFHLMTYIIFKLTPDISLITAATQVSLASYLLLAAALFWLLLRLVGKTTNYRTGGIYAASALGLMLVMPIDIFTPTNLYLGYIVMNAYHSPTMVILKPFSVLLFYHAGQAFIKSEPASPAGTGNQNIWLVVVVTALCILAKPNYAIALLPALMLVTTYAYLRHQFINWTTLIAIILTAGYVLFCEASLFKNTSGIIIAPLAVINSWTRINSDAPNDLVLKFLLSVLFPLLVYIGYFKQAIRSVQLNLAWASFGFGAMYFYLLAESGERLAHGNFAWSGQITLFILFVVSTVFFLQQLRLHFFSLTAKICAVVWVAHLVSGIYWYHVHIVAWGMGDIIGGKW
jgi:hypothetical protein